MTGNKRKVKERREGVRMDREERGDRKERKEGGEISAATEDNRKYQ